MRGRLTLGNVVDGDARDPRTPPLRLMASGPGRMRRSVAPPVRCPDRGPRSRGDEHSLAPPLRHAEIPEDAAMHDFVACTCLANQSTFDGLLPTRPGFGRLVIFRRERRAVSSATKKASHRRSTKARTRRHARTRSEHRCGPGRWRSSRRRLSAVSYAHAARAT